MATPSGPRNSRALAVPSGIRAMAAMNSMVTPPVTTPRAIAASRVGRRNRHGRGRTATSRITEAQASRSQTVPSGPSLPNSGTDSARPIWTQVIEPTAIRVAGAGRRPALVIMMASSIPTGESSVST